MPDPAGEFRFNQDLVRAVQNIQFDDAALVERRLEAYLKFNVADNPHYTVVYFTSSSSFAIGNYPWARKIKVTVVGGGGGGGGVAGTGAGTQAESGGGGGGGCAIETLGVNELSASETVTVGAGGSGGAAGNNNGSAGGTSSFGSFCSATGGSGGNGDGGGSAVAWSNRGYRGTGSGGDINLSGDMGGNGRRINSTTLTTGGHNFGGGGAGPYGGGIAQAVGSSAAAQAGENYGGGGSGARNGFNQSSRAGGDGADGLVVVEVYG